MPTNVATHGVGKIMVKIVTEIPAGLALELSCRLAAKGYYQAAHDVVQAVHDQYVPKIDEACQHLQNALGQFAE